MSSYWSSTSFALLTQSPSTDVTSNIGHPQYLEDITVTLKLLSYWPPTACAKTPPSLPRQRRTDFKRSVHANPPFRHEIRIGLYLLLRFHAATARATGQINDLCGCIQRLNIVLWRKRIKIHENSSIYVLSFHFFSLIFDCYLRLLAALPQTPPGLCPWNQPGDFRPSDSICPLNKVLAMPLWLNRTGQCQIFISWALSTAKNLLITLIDQLYLQHLTWPSLSQAETRIPRAILANRHEINFSQLSNGATARCHRTKVIFPGRRTHSQTVGVYRKSSSRLVVIFHGK